MLFVQFSLKHAKQIANNIVTLFLDSFQVPIFTMLENKIDDTG